MDQVMATLHRKATLAALTTVGAVLAAIPSVTAVSTSDRGDERSTTLHVSGTQTAVEGNHYKSWGGLRGDYWILTARPVYESDSLVVLTGRERFVGCADVDRDKKCGAAEPSGQLRFHYLEWIDLDPKTGELLESTCAHPIIGGTGSFTGARGDLRMHGVMVDGVLRVTYRGTVELDAARSESAPRQEVLRTEVLPAPAAVAARALPHC
jgi:hypothetical protein